jgi:membrane-associated protease RseP (regulator of RpoE activity)
VVKRSDFDGYGFNLHAEKGKPGQYIGKVDDHSPAESAGLRQGDRILEVNGQNISSETHKQVVERIKVVSNHTRLLVIDPKADIHNHQQMSVIEKVKKEAEAKLKAKDVENNNNNNNHKTNGSSISEQLIMEEMKREVENLELKLEAAEANGNGHSSSNGSITPPHASSSSSPSSPTFSKLNLPMTAAEMRAQLKSKKRPDPKNEGIDVRKKYEIIQKM